MNRNRFCGGGGGFAQRNNNGTGTTIVNTSKQFMKAKNPANQDGVDRLMEIKIKAEKNPNSNFVFTVKRALKSLADCKTPITTLSEATALKYVGPRMAKVILADGGEPKGQSKAPKKKPPATSKSKATTASKNASSSSTLTQQILTTNNTSGSTTTSTKRKKTTTTTKKEQGPSTKEKNYNKAKLDAENLRLPKAPWKIILLIDGREWQSKHVVSKCRQSGIPCEERHLPIGDMAWIARCDNDDGTTTEVMCGTIIERKEVSDLASSLFGTRYAEQRLRLQHSGLPQVLFLVEGNLNHCSNCPADTLRMAMVETRVQLGFQVLHTKHLQDTVRVLKGLHRMVVQRAFPPNSYEGELPTFHEGGNRKKRRRPTSLLEMVFDSPPVPALGAKRFITYPELKAKIEWDRERGARSVKAIYLAMLKQVATLSNKKCEGIAREYPTLNSLMTAFAESSEKQKVVQNVVCERKNVGLRSSSELYVACCTQRDGKVMEHQYLSTSASVSASSQQQQSKKIAPKPKTDTTRTTSSEKKASSKTLSNSREEKSHATTNRGISKKQPPANSSSSPSALVDLTEEETPTVDKDLDRAIRASLEESRRRQKSSNDAASSPLSLSFSSPESRTTTTPVHFTAGNRPMSSSSSDTSFQSPADSKPAAKPTTTFLPQFSKASNCTSSCDGSLSSSSPHKKRKLAVAAAAAAAAAHSSSLSQTSNSIGDTWSPSSHVAEERILPPPAKTPAAKVISSTFQQLNTTKTPSSASSFSHGYFTSPDDSISANSRKTPPTRMVSLESAANDHDDSNPLFSSKKKPRRPRPVANKENNIVLELSSDDDDDEINEDLKTRLGKRFKKDDTDVIEID